MLAVIIQFIIIIPIIFIKKGGMVLILMSIQIQLNSLIAFEIKI